MASKVKELAKSRTECAEKDATIAAMKIDMQTLNKAIEDAKNKVQNSEQEVGIRRLQVAIPDYHSYLGESARYESAECQILPKQ